MITLYVGGQPGTIQGQPDTLTGYRMFTAANSPKRIKANVAAIAAYLDSGAFSDPPERRLMPDQALDRQLAWETRASAKWGVEWQARALVSYDLLIDEVWLGGQRHKRRWSIEQAEKAVSETVEAARYLTSQRERLGERRLILSCQGVDAIQYRECLQEILAIAQPGDIIGFGGWCILGRLRSWLPEFWRTIHTAFPLIAQAGPRQVHIFGVLYQPALGGMLWLADQYGLEISTDSSAPIRSAACTSIRTRKKAGCRVNGDWRENVQWWIDALANLRQSEFYCEPPKVELSRQLSLF